MSVEQVADMLERSEELPEGPTKIGLIEQAVALADSCGDGDARYEARKQLTRAAVFGGRIDVAMVSFAWTLAAADRDPDKHPIGELLWQYKWLTENLPHLHTIPVARMAGLFADMATRYARFGSSLHAVYQIRRDVAAQMGDRRTAAALDKKFRATERDLLSNCAACVLDSNVDYHLLRGDDAAALEESRPALAGKVTCGEVPHRTHAIVLLPNLRLGRVEKAVTSHKAGYRLVRDNPKFVPHQACHLAFLALTGNWNRAARALKRHLPDALAAPCHSWTFDFLCATELLANRVIDARIDGIAPPDAAPVSDWDQLRDWAHAESTRLAELFDRRNGTTLFADKKAEWAAQTKYAVARPLDV